MALILDAGALIAIDSRDRRVGAILRLAQQNSIAVRTSSAAIAQVWRDGARQANLARVLTGIDERPLDHPAGRQIGALLRNSSTSDVVDGHIAVLASRTDTVLTSDPDDIKHLLDGRGIDAGIVTV